MRPDRSFTFELRTPVTSYLLLRAAGVAPKKGKLKGTGLAGTEWVGEVSLKHVWEIANLKKSVRSKLRHGRENHRVLMMMMGGRKRDYPA